MRFTIKYKLFLTLLLATLAVVVSMVFLVKWSFERGFLEYVNKLEQEVHNNLQLNLADAYWENGSWNFIRENPRRWKEIHRASMPLPEADEQGRESRTHMQPRPGAKKEDRVQPERRPRPSHFDRHRRGGVCLLDENREVITHCRLPVEDLQLKDIVVDGKTVGYLGIAPRKKLSDEHDLHFSETQHRFLLVLGLCITLISVLLAFPLSRQLVKPIRNLAEATRKLAAGQYQTRITTGSSDELGDLSRDFNSLALALESNETARQQWIADISHELRTPLSVLRGEIEALQDGVREVSAARLDSLHQQVMNLNRLVNDLYELSMSDIGALNYEKDFIDVAAVLNGSIASLRDEFEHKHITISLAGVESAVEIFADSERLQQLFGNLLTNALRYTDADGELRITLEEREKSVSITLEDSAPGVGDADLPRLFERLYRVDSSRNRETGGTGLGLAICKNIIDAHGGNISAGNSTLGGLRIQIDLPKN